MEGGDPSVFASTYDELYPRYSKLESLANHGHPAVRETLLQRYAELQEQFTHVLHTRDLVDVGEVEAAEKEAVDLENEVENLKKEIEELREMPPVERNKAIPTAEALHDPSTLFRKKVSDIHGQLQLARWVFGSILGRSVNDIRDEKVPPADVKFVEKSWSSKKETIERLFTDATELGAQLGLSMPKSLKEEYDLKEAVEREAEEAQAHLNEALEARAERDAQLKEFSTQCEKLCRWCREQLANMDTMTEPDHVQEFCGTLIDSYPTMSSNFGVLLSSVEPFLKANYAPVCRALLEANELWFYLQVTTLERLSKILYEIHPTSALEMEVKKYADFPASLAQFEEDLRSHILSLPSTGDSNDTLLECDEIAPLLKQYKALSKEIEEFAERNHIARNGYQCLKEAILSRLTYIDPTDNVVMDSRRRQQEFEDSVKELRKWAAEVSHGESWRDIYSKIVEIKRLIKEEQSVLDDLNCEGTL